MADWEKSIKEAEVRIGLKCNRRRRRSKRKKERKKERKTDRNKERKLEAIGVTTL